MTHTKRVLATVVLAGAALSLSGVAQAQENQPPLLSSDAAPAANDDTSDAASDGFVPVFNKQTRELLSKVVKGELGDESGDTLG